MQKKSITKSRTKKVRNPFAISAKRLAELNTPSSNRCNRCFFVRNLMHKEGRDAPYSMPVAGLLSRMDSMQKHLVHDSVDLPNFLKKYRGQESIKAKRMYWTDVRTGIEVSGVPDLIFKDKHGRLSVLDLKTSKPKVIPSSGDLSGAFAKIISIYAGQLHAYKYLLEKNGLGKVDNLSLVYLWPEEVQDAPNGVSVRFQATEIPVSVDDRLVDRLLGRAQKILLAGILPPPKNTCVDCVRTAHFLSLFEVETREERNVLNDVQVFVP